MDDLPNPSRIIDPRVLTMATEAAANVRRLKIDPHMLELLAKQPSLTPEQQDRYARQMLDVRPVLEEAQRLARSIPTPLLLDPSLLRRLDEAGRSIASSVPFSAELRHGLANFVATQGEQFSDLAEQVRHLPVTANVKIGAPAAVAVAVATTAEAQSVQLDRIEVPGAPAAVQVALLALVSEILGAAALFSDDARLEAASALIGIAATVLVLWVLLAQGDSPDKTD